METAALLSSFCAEIKPSSRCRPQQILNEYLLLFVQINVNSNRRYSNIGLYRQASEVNMAANKPEMITSRVLNIEEITKDLDT
jgi:hypothetical protein